MAEALLRQRGGKRFAAFSAGIEPGEVRPLTLRVLRDAGVPAHGLRSKSVAELAGHRFDYVITVCDGAREACPVFPGGGTVLHWSHVDPSAATGTDDERLRAFRDVFEQLARRVDELVAGDRQPATAAPAGRG